MATSQSSKVKTAQQMSVKSPEPRLPQEGFVKIPQIIEVFPVSRSGWWKGVKDGKYPAPIKLGPKTAVWKVQDIRKLIADFSNSSNDAQA